MKTYEMHGMAARDGYKLLISVITPRPIAWVSTLSPGGKSNLAPFSFFNGVGAAPPSLLFSCVNRRDGSAKDTLINVKATGDFVVNLATFDNRLLVNESAAEFAYEDSEIEALGLTPVPSIHVAAPRIGESPVQMECKLHQIVTVGQGPLAAHVIIGTIAAIHIDPKVCDANGDIDAGALDTIGRMGGVTYARTTDRFDLPRPALKKT